MFVNVTRFVAAIGAVSVVLVIFVNLGEVIALIEGTLRSQTQNITPVYVKLLKDVLFISTISFCFLWLVTSRRAVSYIKLLLSYWLLFLLLAALIASYELPIICLLLGVRWIMPMLLTVLLLELVDRRGIDTIVKFVKYVFFIHFSLQLVQLFFGGLWYGSFFGGYSLRNPGLFLIPSSGALFSCLSFLLLTFFSRIRFSLLASVAFFSVLMTVSMTGVAIMILFIAYVLLRRFFRPASTMLFMLIVCLCLILCVDQFSYLLGRGSDVVAVSGGARADIFLDTLGRVNFVSRSFGLGTNAAVIYFDGRYEAFITDSMYVSVLANLGFLGFFSFIIMIFTFFARSISVGDDFSILLGLFIMLSSLSSVIFELYPINFIVPFAVAYSLRAKNIYSSSLVKRDIKLI